MAIVAGVAILLVVLLVLRQHLAGQTGPDIDVLPGRAPVPAPETSP
jgi:alpha-1,6-mannosyltransferase